MATTILVDDMIKAGEALVEALDDANVEVRSAFWFYDREDEDWQLIVGMPLVDEAGPARAYEVIRGVLKQLGLPLFLRQISVRSPKDELVDLIRQGLPTPPGIHSMRVMRSAIRSVPIEDVFIYRSCST